jgi:glutaredoxin
MRIIRFFLGRLILLINWITLPKPLHRSQQQQEQLDDVTCNLFVYEMLACPFCVKVRREIHRLGLNINTINVKLSKHEMDRLVNEGGKFQVPCLRIDSPVQSDGKENISGNSDSQTCKWLYESDQIIEHIQTLTNSTNKT